MKVEINHTDDKDDIIVTLHGLNGRTVKIAVPKEDSRNDWVWNESQPFGLNLVTASHYE